MEEKARNDSVYIALQENCVPITENTEMVKTR